MRCIFVFLVRCLICSLPATDAFGGSVHYTRTKTKPEKKKKTHKTNTRLNASSARAAISLAAGLFALLSSTSLFSPGMH